ncbi:MAG: hypothetical protein LBT42_02335, partial [Tannerella sp.]|nr:hypothetical protein [Tannerella sp.]
LAMTASADVSLRHSSCLLNLFSNFLAMTNTGLWRILSLFPDKIIKSYFVIVPTCTIFAV